jgi:3',5'-cyclic AMP phosphodiesterase CpdA
VHFGPPHRPEAAAGVLSLVAARRPDLVVLSGDLTQRAKARQFREARAFVDALGVPALVVPGNHDVPLYRLFERLLAPFRAYREHFAAELEPEFSSASLLAAGINTAHNWTLKNGIVRFARLAEVATLLRGGPANALKVVVAHHPLVRLPGFPNDLPAAHAHPALQVLAAAGAELILGGHLHQGFAGRSEQFLAAPGMILAYAGTASSLRGRGGERGQCSCNWVEWDASSLTVTRLRWDEKGEEFAEQERSRFPRRPRPRTSPPRPPSP